ncbi:hypothetical protein GCM10008906_23390 [Clostridium oceanicum]|uniref:Uncharacterized protein n=1 Tax=Clostridium oceanicum TaxID=1543 RepID=A0ABP3UVD9_9CLOT
MRKSTKNITCKYTIIFTLIGIIFDILLKYLFLLIYNFYICNISFITGMIIDTIRFIKIKKPNKKSSSQ